MCEHAVKKLPYLLRYVPDQYKIQQMCDKVILENDGTLKILTATKIKKCVIKQFIDVFLFDSIPDQNKTQEICDSVVKVLFYVTSSATLYF